MITKPITGAELAEVLRLHAARGSSAEAFINWSECARDFGARMALELQALLGRCVVLEEQARNFEERANQAHAERDALRSQVATLDAELCLARKSALEAKSLKALRALRGEP